MAQCPVCGSENPPEASNCQSCQLATSLFDSVREAAGSGSDNSDYSRAIAEILAAVGPEADEAASAADQESHVMVTAQSRFPSLAGPRSPEAIPSKGPMAPSLPALPPGSGLSLVQRQVEELLQVGRREGLDVKEADQRMLVALKEESRAELDDLRRSLFVRVAGSVAEDLEVQTARRNELAALVPCSTIDAELTSARTAFATGDLSGATRRLRQASDGLSALEDRWATCQILIAEAELMVETLRELGKDPTPALGPLAQGRRLARAGESERAERVLAGANRALWELLVPQMNDSLQAVRAQLHGRSSTEAEIEPVVHELRQLAAMIRRRNFGPAVTAFRRLQAAASALATPVST